MRKKLFVACAALLAGMAGVWVYSCTRGDLAPSGGGNSLSTSVLHAKAFFDTEVGSPSLPNTYFKADSAGTRSRGSLTQLSGAVKPDWKRVRTWETDSIFGTEAAARFNHSIDYATIVEKRGDTVSLTVQQPHVWILFNEHKETGETLCFLASLLPDESYTGDPELLGSNPEGSDYWGIAIYSDPDGTPLWGYRFEAGEITNTLLFDEEYDGEVDPNVKIGMGIAPATAGTRGWMIFTESDGSVIIAWTIETIPVVEKAIPQREIAYVSRSEDTGGLDDDKPSGGGTIKPGQMFTVSVSASPSKGGEVSGEGSYGKNASLSLTATPNAGYEFVRWTGGGNTKTYNSTSRTLTVTVTENMELTAMFSGGEEEKLPCADEENNKVNPLTDMALAAPVPWNIAGATFGWTRKKDINTPKYHNGIDLAGPIGTPVYAQFDGVIGGTIVSNQPNRIDGELPSGYSGDDDYAGNRLSVISTVGGKTVTNSYWHLRAGEPFGINPRENRPWASGDLIYTGEIIGYIGISGNADPNIPHLHLKTTENSEDVNPAKYLNATVNPKSKTITTPCD